MPFSPRSRYKLWRGGTPQNPSSIRRRCLVPQRRQPLPSTVRESRRALTTARTGRPACGTRRERAGQYPRRSRSTCTRNPEVSPSRNRRGRPARFRNYATFVNAASTVRGEGRAADRVVGWLPHGGGASSCSRRTSHPCGADTSRGNLTLPPPGQIESSHPDCTCRRSRSALWRPTTTKRRREDGDTVSDSTIPAALRRRHARPPPVPPLQPAAISHSPPEAATLTLLQPHPLVRPHAPLHPCTRRQAGGDGHVHGCATGGLAHPRSSPLTPRHIFPVQAGPISCMLLEDKDGLRPPTIFAN